MKLFGGEIDYVDYFFIVKEETQIYNIEKLTQPQNPTYPIKDKKKEKKNKEKLKFVLEVKSKER